MSIPVSRKIRDSVYRAAGVAVVLSDTETEKVALGLLAEGWTPPQPQPVTEEPLDPAVRLIGMPGHVWARYPNGRWLAPGHDWHDWDFLVENYGPLRLFEESD